jgi:multicomponent Na+:H+ antiporter subunit G
MTLPTSGRGVIAVLVSSVATENAEIITSAVLGIAFVVLPAPGDRPRHGKAAHRRSAGQDGASGS